uniref:Uncharacterized protein n=1 Tax=Rhizophora mucronata TaxID=61149 RepID=A0A2P2R0M1_RHIMU
MFQDLSFLGPYSLSFIPYLCPQFLSSSFFSS